MFSVHRINKKKNMFDGFSNKTTRTSKWGGTVFFVLNDFYVIARVRKRTLGISGIFLNKRYVFDEF